MLRVFTMRRYISSKTESLDRLKNIFIAFKRVILDIDLFYHFFVASFHMLLFKLLFTGCHVWKGHLFKASLPS